MEVSYLWKMSVQERRYSCRELELARSLVPLGSTAIHEPAWI
ncbi:MAG: hypothetical protein QXP29_07815 [Candidatus Nezhaarchaeales archaeon]